MNESKHYKARAKFENRISKGLLGPGSEYWGVPENEELISDYPLIRYFTGILFPKKKIERTVHESESNQLESATLLEDEYEFGIEPENDGLLEQLEEENSDKKDKSEDNFGNNNFFPTNMGITVCLSKGVKEIEVEFCFGLYHQASAIERKFKLSQEEYDFLVDENSNINFPLKDKIMYDGIYLFFAKKIVGNSGGKTERSGEYILFDEWKKEVQKKLGKKLRIVGIIEKLISTRVWKREEFRIAKKINVNKNINQEVIYLDKRINKLARLNYAVRRYQYQGNTYIKILLINDSEEQSPKKFSNKKEELNKKCIFQSEIKVISNRLEPYRDYNDLNLIDEEAAKLNFMYRNVKSYGIGHNCSVTWDGIKPNSVMTTFLPSKKINSIRNNIEEFSDNNDIFNIKNLSEWGIDKERVIENLQNFTVLYSNWIKNQEIQVDNEKNKDIGLNLIKQQNQCLKRIEKNILLLENEQVFKAFQLTNLVMLIQFMVNSSKEIGSKEREITEAHENYPDNFGLEYLKALYNKFDDKRIPRYRPFQLAFILLSIDGIVDELSEYRKDVVDLVWFPTGGGKTEAYLAVAAFTIIWRRMTKEVYEGTTVIMRYTLRLLTAQQFERASRIIVTLEYLRRQKEFRKLLGDQTISIGLWVGSGATPNNYKDANKQIKVIHDKFEKETSNPEEDNTFQISTCPWCGTKLISKLEDGDWVSGFNGNNNRFTIRCNNNKCEFSEELPINVVDEALYKNPPTLLFGTLDKFAVLALKSNSYRFFNTDDDAKLPPDLIIQDELHLLNGPLGSISGLFESVIELLCTKNGIAPKIITSTATTRNSDYQVSKLYGNRIVNIFPPSGLEFDDCFFSKETKDSKRKYLGILPTGKTVVDTQLHILSHLFLARMEVYGNNELNEVINDYWTIVSYYNSLRDVGRTMNKISDEVTTFTGTLHHRHAGFIKGIELDNQFHYKGLMHRTKELTSRIPSEKIKSTLKDIERDFEDIRCKKISDKGYVYLTDIVDLVLATNMLSVGIDIDRLNIMLINGMPMNNAEYIQASSRIARANEGLVVTLFNSNRAREKSYFEHFIHYHQSFYKEVEPISVTPFTENTLKIMLTTMVLAYLRNMYPGKLNKDNDLQNFESCKLDPLIAFLSYRYKDNSEELFFFKNQIEKLIKDLIDRISNNYHKYSELVSSERDNNDDVDWFIMHSLRETDTITFIEKKQEI